MAVWDFVVDKVLGDVMGYQTFNKVLNNIRQLRTATFLEGTVATLSADPPNGTGGTLIFASGTFETDEHNGRIVVFTSGDLNQEDYEIDDNTGSLIISSGVNFYALGARSGDTVLIYYNYNTQGGHSHDKINSAGLRITAGDLATDSVGYAQMQDNSIGNAEMRDNAIGNAEMRDNAIGNAEMLGNAIHQAELYTTTSEQSNSGSDSNEAVTGGTYCFWPQTKVGSASAGRCQVAQNLGATSYATIVNLGNDVGHAMYSQFRYVRSSGHINWLFMLKVVSSGLVVSGSWALDHPCYGNGANPDILPHPFVDVYTKPDGKTYKIIDNKEEEVEVICCNPSEDEYKDYIERSIGTGQAGSDRSVLEVIMNDFEIDQTYEPDWPEDEVIVGLPKKAYNLETEEEEIIEDWKKEYFHGRGLLIVPIKKKITKPSYVKTFELKEK